MDSVARSFPPAAPARKCRHPLPRVLTAAMAIALLVTSLASAADRVLAPPRAPRTIGGPPAPNPDAAAPGAEAVRPTDVAARLARVSRELEAARGARQRLAPAGARAALGDFDRDEIGGDDVLITSHDDVLTSGAPVMDIAANGDIYVALEVEVVAHADYDIRLYRSQDGGRTWRLWGTRENPADGRGCRMPSLLVADGTPDRVFLAYQYLPAMGPQRIEVAAADPAQASAAFTVVTVMDSTGYAFANPHLCADDVDYPMYYVYLVADAQETGSDWSGIWFARSTNQGETWAAEYTIAELPALDNRRYYGPQVAYGTDQQLHCVWTFIPPIPGSGTVDRAIRYRRAVNYGGGSGDWDPIVYLTTNDNGVEESSASVAASRTTGTILVGYFAYTTGDDDYRAEVWPTYDGGVTWAPADRTLPEGVDFPYDVLALPGAGGFALLGGRLSADNAGITRAADTDPLTWSEHLSFPDRDYANRQGWGASRMGACDPTHGNRVALAWNATTSPDGPDSVWFDAEWRSDPGFPNLEPGFPLALPAGVISPPGICELDGDSQSEIVFGDTEGKVHARNHDGTSLPGWPHDIGTIPHDGPVAVGDLDGDGRDEVVCGNATGWVYAWRADGSAFPGWPVFLGYADSAYVSIGALSGVSNRQVVACVGTHVCVLSAAGAMLPGFPLGTAGPIRASAAIGDVDGDGDREVVILQQKFMNVITGSGVSQASRNFTTSAKTFSNAPTLADLNADGDLEIAAPTDQGDLYVLNPDGSDFPGFPFADPTGGRLTSVAIAQILGTTSPELVYSVETAAAPQVRALQADGATLIGYPVPTGVGWFLLGQPVLDVLDGGSPDVVVASRDGSAYAWNNFGDALPGWPEDLDLRTQVSAATGDLDGDGKVEVVLASRDPARLVVIDLGAPAARSGSVSNRYWPMYGYNPERQGCLACGADAVVSVPATGTAPTRLSFAPPVPNPSGGRVSLAFDLPVRAAVTLTIYDVAGRQVRELVRSEWDPGRHACSWDGRDDGGVVLSPGVYYARLGVDAPAGSEPVVRKITLLR